MKRLFLSFVAIAGLLLTFNQQLSAQEREVGKQVYIEFGGPGLVMSFNFDSRFIPSERLGFGARIGAGFAVKQQEEGTPIIGNGGEITTKTRNKTYYSFPIGVNYVLGKPSEASTFEVGAVVMLYTDKVHPYNYYGTEKASNVNYCLTFMYRVAPMDGGMSFRIGFTPILGASGNLYPTGAIGFGYAF